VYKIIVAKRHYASHTKRNQKQANHMTYTIERTDKENSR